MKDVLACISVLKKANIAMYRVFFTRFYFYV